MAGLDVAPRAQTAATMRAFFHPASVAVIGASRERGALGGEVFHNLLRYAPEKDAHSGSQPLGT